MKTRFSVIALSLLSFASYSQIKLVKDLNEWPLNGSISWQPTVVNHQMFFVVNDGVHGEELWKSDGTADGTMLIKDIVPTNSSFPSDLTRVNNLLFFTAWDGVNTGRELWKSDGTPAGTVMVKNFLMGDENDGPIQLTELDGILYFIGGDATGGRELWRTDGSAVGTSIVKNIAVGWEGVYGLTKANGKLFFEGYSEAHGRELWVSDGTSAGTHEVKDIFPGSLTGTNLVLSELQSYDNGVYFIGDDGVNGKEIWKSDGTEAGTMMIMDFFPGNNGNGVSISEAVCIGNKLFFTTGSNELWSTEGTEATTKLVKAIVDPNEFTYPQNFFRYGDKLLFSARSVDTGGDNLWISDGTEEGTKKLKSVNDTELGHIDRISESNGKVYFSVNDGHTGFEPWVTDGTTEGTYRLFDLVAGSESSDARDFVFYEGQTFFIATKVGFGQALFREDGTVVKDIQVRTGSSIPWPSFSFQHQLFFFDGFGGRFWKSDGTANGTVKIRDHLTGGNPSDFVEFNDKGFFVATDGFSSTTNIFVTDGTTEGTKSIFELARDTRSNLIVHQGFLYFCNNNYFYKSDGTEAGTELIKSVTGYPRALVSSGDYIYFEAKGLWRSDGTEGGTEMIKEFSTGGIEGITASNGIVYFYTTDGAVSLWKSDGVETTIIKTFWNSSSWLHGQKLVDINGTAFFSALFEDQGHVLWKTDGTEAGTVVVKDPYLNDMYPMPWNLKNVNGVLYFTVTGLGNDEVWKSDGTADGTVLVKHWEDAHGLTSLLDLKGELFFVSSSVKTGFSIGKSDGTPAGTLHYYPQEPGNVIHSLLPVDDKIFFVFDSFRYGTELYVLETAPDILCRDFSIQVLEGNDKACVGTPVELKPVVETGNTSLTYTWLKDGNVLSGEEGSTLDILSATLSDEGTYEVRVSNGTCSASSNKFDVMVKDKPVVTVPMLAEISSGERIELFLQSVPDNYNQGYQILDFNIPEDIEAYATNAVTGTDLVGADYLYYDRYKNDTGAPATVQYSVRPVSMMGCMGDEIILSVQIISDVTGNEPEHDEEFMVAYPNPTHTEIRVEFKRPLTETSTLVVFTSEGRTLYSSTIEAENYGVVKIINTRDWKPGMYYVTIRKGKGEVLNKKIIKAD